MSSSKENLAEKYSYLSKFQPKEDLLSEVMFQDWANITILRIVKILSLRSTSQIYSCRAISVMTGKSLGCTIEAIQKLKSKGYLVETSGSYQLDIAKVASDRKADQGDRKTDQIRSENRSEGDRKTDHTNIYNINTNSDHTYTPPIEQKPDLGLVPAKEKTRVTSFKKQESITKEQYLGILNNPSLADGDREFLKWCVEEMADWAASNGKKKADWAATLRNWVRRNLKEKQKFEKRPKTFQEIEDENYKKAEQDFLLKHQKQEIK